MANAESQICGILRKYERELLADWQAELKADARASAGQINDTELRKQTEEFVNHLQVAAQQGNLHELDRPEWNPMRGFLEDISRSRVAQGFSSSQTAAFLFSFKKPLFARLNTELKSDSMALAAESWIATELLDRLGLYTIQVYQRAREEVIRRQQDELLELSTPVVKMWDGILALPMIGTLDSARTQVVMESLLQRIVETGSEIAIIDITGVPTVDTLVAQHLLKTVAAIRLMGADCIISGIRPQIAQTIVHLGVDLTDVTTKANLSDALALALKRSGFSVVKSVQKTAS
jgi:rsbT co-antagonist protein RsbR